MCQISLTSVQGQSTDGVNATTIILSGTAAAQCQTVRLEISACGLSGHIALVPVTNGNWQYSLTAHCLCGEDVIGQAICCDANGNPIPGCGSFDIHKPIVCTPPDCCLSVQIIPSIGDCNANNERLVTFTVNVSVAAEQSSCPLPYVLQLNFGDGNWNPAWVVTGVGSQSFTATHNYNANANYIASLSYILPNNLNCPVDSVPLHIDSCTPNCCPKITDFFINVGDCNDNCERLVEITTMFEPPVGPCPPAYLEWEIVDKNSHSINGSAFITSDPSPRTEQFWLSPANSPYVAKLIIHYPTNCGVAQQQFTVPECHSPATCPEITNFSYAVGGCVAVGDKCCREVSFPCDINVHPGCGGGPQPRVRINYGDGNVEEVSFGTAGPHGVTFTHRYCDEGDYLVTLETLYPTGCPDKILIANVPKCDPKECEVINGNGEKFCPCCIGLLVLVTSYFFLWTEGYYQGDLVILSVNLGSIGGYASFFLLLLVTLLINFCYKTLKACKKCWQCRFYRCLFYALIISIIMIIVMVIIAYYYGNMAAVPGWLPALVNAIIAAWGVYLLMQTEPCKTFYATGKC